MTAPIRIAGWGRATDGSTVTWAVAEGRKGRRWREVRTRGEDVIHSLLLETDEARRFSHLELARADGLWTFHPEADGTLHGNHVGGGDPGIRHFSGWPFDPDDAVVVEGSPLSLAALAWRLAASFRVGSIVSVPGVVIGASGRADQVADIRVRRLSNVAWQAGEGSPFEIDDAGLPVLGDGEIRPLELV